MRIVKIIKTDDKKRPWNIVGYFSGTKLFSGKTKKECTQRAKEKGYEVKS